LGALRGLSLGDALGMPTQSMSHTAIADAYGTITGLNDAIAEQPIAPNMAAGWVTDDTEQALIVAQLIGDGNGHIDPHDFAERLLAWEDDIKARGSLDLLGPSTKLALDQVRHGADISTTGKTGTTNGAAMRVTPVGIANPSTDPALLAERIHESCRVTHNTTPGFQSAALIATAVSLGMDGRNAHEALTMALDMVEEMDAPGAWSPKANVVTRARLALKYADHSVEPDETHFLNRLRAECGTSVESNESVAAAFALAWRHADQPIQALFSAAAIGGDTDTIAAMTGGMLGAAAGPDAFPTELTDQVARVSGISLEPVAHTLVKLRLK
jgi:ADP-ribosylglycohydrolase